MVTSHGRAVARITPVRAEADIAVAARRQLLSWLRTEPVVDATPWTRDELCER